LNFHSRNNLTTLNLINTNYLKLNGKSGSTYYRLIISESTQSDSVISESEKFKPDPTHHRLMS